jgi:hypothetical protein
MKQRNFLPVVYRYCDNYMDKDLFENLTDPPLVKKFPAIYGTRRLITVHKSLQLVPTSSR